MILYNPPPTLFNFEFCIRPLLIILFADKVHVLPGIYLNMQEIQSRDSLEILYMF
jgi:hypothetical protein